MVDIEEQFDVGLIDFTKNSDDLVERLTR